MRMKITIAMIIALILALILTKDANADDRSVEIYEYCQTVGDMYSISPELLQAVAYTESRYNMNAENGDCKGICQINFNVHKDRMDRLGITDAWDEYSQLMMCADYISELRDSGKYGDEIAWVLDRYNGNSKADYNCENGIISDYATKVLVKAHELEVEHGKL